MRSVVSSWGNLNILDGSLMDSEEYYPRKDDLAFNTKGAKEVSVESLDGSLCSGVRVEDTQFLA